MSETATTTAPDTQDSCGGTPHREAWLALARAHAAITGRMHEALTAAEIENFRFHDLRHTRGTRILRQTGNLAAAQKALAHKNIRTTLRYAHAFDDDVRKALEASESRTIPEVDAVEEKKTA